VSDPVIPVPSSADPVEAFLSTLKSGPRKTAARRLASPMSTGTLAVFVDRLIADGYTLDRLALSDGAETRRLHERAAALSREAPLGNPKHPQSIALAETRALIALGVYQETRRLRHPSGASYWEDTLGKIAFDYAEHRMEGLTGAKVPGLPEGVGVSVPVSVGGGRSGWLSLRGKHRLLELPGGRVEPGERPVDAAVRELFEETGFRVSRSDLVCLWTGIINNGENSYARVHQYLHPAGIAAAQARELRTETGGRCLVSTAEELSAPTARFPALYRLVLTLAAKPIPPKR